MCALDFIAALQTLALRKDSALPPPLGGGGGGNSIEVALGTSRFYVHSLNKDFTGEIGILSNFGLGTTYDATGRASRT